MINMDQPIYQELAALIEFWHSHGQSWVRAQTIALADLNWRYGWRPQ